MSTVWSDSELELRQGFSCLLDGQSFTVRRVPKGTRVGGFFSGSQSRAFDVVRDIQAEERAEAEAAVQAARPTVAKGVYIKRCTVSSTMGPGLQIALREQDAA